MDEPAGGTNSRSFRNRVVFVPLRKNAPIKALIKQLFKILYSGKSHPVSSLVCMEPASLFYYHLFISPGVEVSPQIDSQLWDGNAHRIRF